MLPPKKPPPPELLRFLKDAAMFYKDLCPEQSRFFMRKHHFLNQDHLATKKEEKLSRRERRTLSPDVGVCPSCFQWRHPDNHRVRIRAKPRPSARVRRVLQRERRMMYLSPAQRHLYRRFRNARTVVMATCHFCNTTSRRKGPNRNMGYNNIRTPPQNLSQSCRPSPKTPMFMGKKKPLGTPSSSSSYTSSPYTSSPYTSSPHTPSPHTPRPASTKKTPGSRLMKLLKMDNKLETKKISIKNFLSSL